MKSYLELFKKLFGKAIRCVLGEIIFPGTSSLLCCQLWAQDTIDLLPAFIMMKCDCLLGIILMKYRTSWRNNNWIPIDIWRLIFVLFLIFMLLLNGLHLRWCHANHWGPPLVLLERLRWIAWMEELDIRPVAVYECSCCMVDEAVTESLRRLLVFRVISLLSLWWGDSFMPEMFSYWMMLMRLERELLPALELFPGCISSLFVWNDFERVCTIIFFDYPCVFLELFSARMQTGFHHALSLINKSLLFVWTTWIRSLENIQCLAIVFDLLEDNTFCLVLLKEFEWHILIDSSQLLLVAIGIERLQKPVFIRVLWGTLLDPTGSILRQLKNTWPLIGTILNSMDCCYSSLLPLRWRLD